MVKSSAASQMVVNGYSGKGVVIRDRWVEEKAREEGMGEED